MATVLTVDERTASAKAFLAFVKQLPFVTIEENKPRYNAETEKVIHTAKKGKDLTRVKNYKTLIKDLVD